MRVFQPVFTGGQVFSYKAEHRSEQCEQCQSGKQDCEPHTPGSIVLGLDATAVFISCFSILICFAHLYGREYRNINLSVQRP